MATHLNISHLRQIETESLLYIDNNINHIVQDDLCIYKTKEPESVFIKIINSRGKNTIVACAYRHPCMNPTEFIDIYLSELLQKFSKEDKTIMLMGDFNIELLKYDHNKGSASFLDSLYTKLSSIIYLNIIPTDNTF